MKGIVDLHGGVVRAENAGLGKGATFLVTLPLVPPAVEHDLPSPSSQLLGPRRRVLVVDDNADTADTLADMVRMLGCDVAVAYDGRAAIEEARTNRPEVILCDIGMPGLEGYDVARELRAGGLSDVQLIAVSGYARPEDVSRALAAGFDGHLAKPPAPNEIEELFRR